MPKKQFKAESKRLLELMINSIYTHKEIFLRELISNASDAMDKRYYSSLSGGETGLAREELFIEVRPDKNARTLTISDRGCGMNKEELEQNLGTIAKSGSLAFKEENGAAEDIDIIGQFGVGFYSAFMVAKKVRVLTRPAGSDEGWCWESDGSDGYTVTPCQKDEVGSTIVLTLKDNTEEEDYDEFLSDYRIQGLVKKYSDYIRYPIRMEMTRSRKKEGTEDQYEDYQEVETLNSMVPIWKKAKAEVTDEEMDQFYQDKFGDFTAPLRVIRSSTEGAATYNALLFIPARAPYNYYNRDYEKGLQLYASGVLIMDRCPDLLPDCFSFVKGLVDSQDLSLNISREMLQHDRQLKLIAGRLEKKIASELGLMLKNDRDKYEEFFKAFGLQLKFGVYSTYGAQGDLLKDLLLFHSSQGEKPTTLEEYASRMKEDQKAIYYACGQSREQLEHLPQTELVKEKGYEILYLTDDVDEFCVRALGKYGEHDFKSVSDGDLDLASQEEKDQVKEQNDKEKELLDCMKAALGDQVKEVRLSVRLKTGPVCLTTDGGITLEMEKVFAQMPGGEEKLKAERVLELNGGHPVFQKLQGLYQAGEKELVGTYAQLLYAQAQLLEGLQLEDPVAFSKALGELLGR